MRDNFEFALQRQKKMFRLRVSDHLIRIWDVADAENTKVVGKKENIKNWYTKPKQRRRTEKLISPIHYKESKKQRSRSRSRSRYHLCKPTFTGRRFKLNI